MHFATINAALLLQARAVPPKEYTFGEGRAQVVCCLIAAYAMCQFPLDLDLSDGKRHHLLRLRGDQLMEYLNCTPKQVQLHSELVSGGTSELKQNWLQNFACTLQISANQLCLVRLRCIIDASVLHICHVKCFVSAIMIDLLWQAYSAMAQTLLQQGDMAASTASLSKPPEQLDEALAWPFKKLKGLVQGCALLDQVESIISHSPSVNHQIQTAFEMAMCNEPPMLDCVRAFYGR